MSAPFGIHTLGVVFPKEALPLQFVGTRIERFELMQFTGLLDKNGKEIYESDVIRVCHYECDDESELNSFSTHEIVWCGEYPAFDIKPNYDDMMNGLQAIGFGAEDCPLWCEVIGNIYESPELLSHSDNRHFARQADEAI